MHKNILFAIAALLLAACSSNQIKEPQIPQDSTPTPSRIDIYPRFASQYVPARTIRVYVPENYDNTKRYDVLYMHDGTMLFDASITWNHQEWGVDEAMDSLIHKGYVRPAIVVGIDNMTDTPNRLGEYCPDDIVTLLPEGSSVYNCITPKGNDYLRFLVEEVKPFIDSVYSTYTDRQHTFTMGSSCGGLISSYALCKYPEVFGGAACMSTHCTLAYPNPDQPDNAVMTAYRTYLQQHIPANSTLLYFDRGDQTLDAYYGEAQDAINAMLVSSGWDDSHFQYRFFPGHAHEEKSWRARLDIPLRFLLGK
ncbi:MAG: esterase family protein [Paludibacteraceae bacterium]|nr:esterase family protein [Paludibacteraceae bacterium]